MKITDLSAETQDSIETMMNLGWSLTNIYGDGVVSVSRRVNNVEVMCFIDELGRIHRPRTHETMIAEAHLHEQGVILARFQTPAKEGSS